VGQPCTFSTKISFGIGYKSWSDHEYANGYSQTLELQTDIYGTDSLVVCVKFDVDKIWALDGGEREKTNMFILQPSEGIV
jgi:hypothetical protein